MLRGFFGNLIFAIIAQMLCGNHLIKRNNEILLNVFVLNFQSEEKILKKVRRKIKNKVCELVYPVLFKNYYFI